LSVNQVAVIVNKELGVVGRASSGYALRKTRSSAEGSYTIEVEKGRVPPIVVPEMMESSPRRS
jgi:hypothetical protein